MTGRGWHLGPLVAFDTETTGVDVETDRIVTACVAHIDGTGETPPDVRTWLLDPGVEIPESASAIHGISTERARAEGMTAAVGVELITEALADACVGMPLIIFNAPYDLTLLDRECRRHGLPTLHERSTAWGLDIIDPLVLDRHVVPRRRGKGARKLTALCEVYGVPLVDAHDAAADALGAARIAWVMASRHPETAGAPLPELQALQVRAHAEWARDFQEYLRRDDPAAVVDGRWPILPYGEALEAAA
ncbi:MAG: exonuclease domain-containing protein [Micromonosporaceae bacterium]